MKKISIIYLSFIGFSWINFPVLAEKPIVGNCEELTCIELVDQLKKNWSEQISQYETECESGTRIGLNIWERNNAKVINFICWKQPEKDSTYGNNYYYGEFLGALPYPGYEEKFGSSIWQCYDNDECNKYVAQLKLKEPEKMRKSEIECAMKVGDLRLLISDDQKTADIQCIFWVPNLIDDNGDGIFDGEGKPTGVDIILDTLPISKLPCKFLIQKE